LGTVSVLLHGADARAVPVMDQKTVARAGH